MFKEEREELKFDWSMIGNIGEGRPNLGNTMDVSVYRLMQFTLRDVLIKNYNADTADRIFYEAGLHAGKEFCKELITQKDDFNEFVGELQELLKNLKIGILRIEEADLEKMTFTLTVAAIDDQGAYDTAIVTIAATTVVHRISAASLPPSQWHVRGPGTLIGAQP